MQNKRWKDTHLLQFGHHQNYIPTPYKRHTYTTSYKYVELWASMTILLPSDKLDGHSLYFSNNDDQIDMHWQIQWPFMHFTIKVPRWRACSIISLTTNPALATDSSERNSIALQTLSRCNAKPRCPLNHVRERKRLNSDPGIIKRIPPLCILFIS